MSIDARIIAAELLDNGNLKIYLEPREPKGCAGQNALTITNWPADTTAWGLIGIEIWGGSSEIMVGDTKWAERRGYGQIMLM